jgi:asparagine synthase (glutamine-hydrolysing)
MVGDADAALLERMTARLRHRGPDAGAVHVGDDWGLGHRRLSIIDLEGGAQPMSAEAENVWISYNGEIYDFREHRAQLERAGHRFHTRSDTEVLLRGYLEWGDAVVERVGGMFAFAIWDAPRRRLLLARDRVGVKPLYWATIEGPRGPVLLFASEPKALLEHPHVSRELDVSALDAYLDLLYVPPPRSMFRGIHQLAPGHRLIWCDGRATLERYWDALPEIDHSRTDEEWAEEIAPRLEQAIVSQTVADVPLGAFLSGGLDSSTIVAVLAERGHRPVETFCVGYGAEGRAWDERAEARRVAAHFSTHHHEVEINVDVLGGLEAMVLGFDEPFGSPTALLTHALSRFTRSFVTVALAGDGGDEAFGGYPRYRGMALSRWVSRAPDTLLGWAERLARSGSENVRARAYTRWARQFLSGARLTPAERYASFVTHFRLRERNELLTDDLRARLDEAGRLDPVVEHFERPAVGDLVERAAYADLHGFLPENVLRGSDRMSMAHGLELRVPFCDHRLLEVCMRVPSHQRIGPLVTKRILRRIMRGRLPKQTLRRRKLGFNAPVGVWMQRDLDGLVTRWFGEEQIRRRGLFRPEVVRRFVEEHRSGRRDRTAQLWPLLVFEQWARLYT